MVTTTVHVQDPLRRATLSARVQGEHTTSYGLHVVPTTYLTLSQDGVDIVISAPSHELAELLREMRATIENAQVLP